MPFASNSFTSRNIFLQQLLLCLTGAFAGFLYTFVFFGLITELLLFGAAAGILIVFLYTVLEFWIFRNSTNSSNLVKQYFQRVVAYFLLFAFSFLAISFLHAKFTQLTYGDDLAQIFKEDYSPFLPVFLIYALLAALVFQSIWLINTKRKNALLHDVFINEDLKVMNAEVIVLAVTTPNLAALTEESKIKILNQLFEKVQSEENNAVGVYEKNLLKICIPAGKNIHDNSKIWKEKLQRFFSNHISSSQKMLQLQFGYSAGEIQLQKCGSQLVINGEAVKLAEANMVTLYPENQNAVSASTFKLIV